MTEGMAIFKQSFGCCMIFSYKCLFHLPTLPSSYKMYAKQATNFSSSDMTTALEDMNMSPDLVLTYRMTRISSAFCNVSRARLIYFKLGLNSETNGKQSFIFSCLKQNGCFVPLVSIIFNYRYHDCVYIKSKQKQCFFYSHGIVYSLTMHMYMYIMYIIYNWLF